MEEAALGADSTNDRPPLGDNGDLLARIAELEEEIEVLKGE
jgi:hypothetical protein